MGKGGGKKGKEKREEAKYFSILTLTGGVTG